jgi:phosphate-selective porin
MAFAEPQSTNQEINYHWGRGLSVPQGNLNLGGYFNGSFKHLQSKKNSASLDDISLFISWSPHARLRFFSEIELEEWLSTDTGIHLGDALRVERLYVDFLATESLTLRLGKFLTPVGYWNVTHAATLVWTTTRPLATDEQLFPSHASGLMISKNFTFSEQNLDISLYADDSHDFDIHKDLIDFDYAFGGRLHYEVFEQLHLGVSYLAFNKGTTSAKATNHLFGLDLLWKKNDYELQMEWNYRRAYDLQGSEHNFYIQGVAPLESHLFAVGRYEHLNGEHEINAAVIQGHAHLGIAGVAWRPYTPLSIKAEYRFGTGNQQVAPSGFFTSISMFF